MIPSAVTGIKHKLLRTMILEEYFQIFNIQEYTLNFKHSFSDQPTVASFTRLIEKNFPFFHVFYGISRKYHSSKITQ